MASSFVASQDFLPKAVRTKRLPIGPVFDQDQDDSCGLGVDLRQEVLFLGWGEKSGKSLGREEKRFRIAVIEIRAGQEGSADHL